MKENTVFWIKICFYILILCALIWVGLRAGGDPCERCKLQADVYGDEPITCRELINKTVTPLLESKEIPTQKLNESDFDKLLIPEVR
jgi:hypothetical protein